MAEAFLDIHFDAAGVEELLNSPELHAALIAAGATITGVAIPYSGKFTGELDASMEYEVRADEDGIGAAFLGSGARDGDTIGQAALNWYGHEDPDGVEVDPNYPQWQDHAGVKTQPSMPYEHALNELGIEYEVEPEWSEWATVPGPIV